MFDVEMDVSLTFDPPMNADRRGIILTRRFQLPFVPHKGLALTGQAFIDRPDPQGLMLQNVVWDDDRQVFLVESSTSMQDFPIAIIPDELRSWMERGWRLGSFWESYNQDDEDDEKEELDSETHESAELFSIDDEWGDLEKLPTMAPRGRPRDFNRLMKALIREMAELYNNQDVAYAMDQTGRYFTKAQLEETETAAARKWREALSEWGRMSTSEKIAWVQKVAKNPPLESLV